MSTKISKGARLHLLRCVERLQPHEPRWHPIRELARTLTVDNFRRAIADATSKGERLTIPRFAEITVLF